MIYFDQDEFACKCGCGLKYMEGAFTGQLDLARRISGIPYVITSGRRCFKHNRDIGSKDTSSHLKGWAVDIFADSEGKRFRILKGLINAGIRRIGIRKDFIHADGDKHKTQKVLWLY